MISIIVSSYNQEYFDAFSKNVSQTIGIQYEIIQIWNPGVMGICEAYNKGAEQSKGEYLVFCHEDIELKTLNWGQILVDQFSSDKRLGAIGIAGASYVPYNFMGWDEFLSDYGKINIIQGFRSIKKEVKVRRGCQGNMLEYVYGLDGCFISVPKQVFKEFGFDSDNFKQFHFYDVDFTFRIHKKYKVAVCYDILLKHFSEGAYDIRWLQELENFNKQWQSELPLYEKCINPKVENFAAYRYLDTSIKCGYTIIPYLKMIFSVKFMKIIGLKLYLINILKLPYRLIRLYTKKIKLSSFICKQV